MTNGQKFNRARVYQIGVHGNLDQKWSNWFDGFTVTPQERRNTANRPGSRPGRPPRPARQDP